MSLEQSLMPKNSKGEFFNGLKYQIILSIIQANIGILGLANDLVLAMASKQKIDTIQIQESWVGVQLKRKMIKKYHFYQGYGQNK